MFEKNLNFVFAGFGVTKLFNKLKVPMLIKLLQVLVFSFHKMTNIFLVVFAFNEGLSISEETFLVVVGFVSYLLKSGQED